MITYEQALSRAMARCRKSEKCISEIRQKYTLGVEPADQQKNHLLIVFESVKMTKAILTTNARQNQLNQWGKVKIISC
jgi:hypothetical protein